jgi:hypothetical protein
MGGDRRRGVAHQVKTNKVRPTVIGKELDVQSTQASEIDD